MDIRQRVDERICFLLGLVQRLTLLDKRCFESFLISKSVVKRVLLEYVFKGVT